MELASLIVFPSLRGRLRPGWLQPAELVELYEYRRKVATGITFAKSLRVGAATATDSVGGSHLISIEEIHHVRFHRARLAPTHNVLRARSLGRTLNTFHYDILGLSGAPAEPFLARPEPLAWAFAALMRPGDLVSPAELRFACLRRIVAAKKLSENRRFLLFNFVATVIESDRGTADEYDELFARADNREVRTHMMTWAQKIETKGYESGRQQGRQEGRQEGRHQGRQQGMQEIVLGLVEERFGPLADAVASKIRAIDSATRLTELAKKMAVVESLAELRLD